MIASALAKVTKIVGRSATEGSVLVYTVTVTKSTRQTSAIFSFGKGSASWADIGKMGEIRYTNGVYQRQDKLFIPKGVTSFQVKIPTKEDGAKERNETVAIRVGSKAAAAGIINDDRRPGAKVKQIVGHNAREGGNLVYTVTLDKSPQPTSAGFEFGYQNANNWTDLKLGKISFTNNVKWDQGRLMIPAGVTSFDVIIPSRQDNAPEVNETARIWVGSKFGDAKIVNDDVRAAVVQNLVARTDRPEGDGLTFDVFVQKNSYRTVTVWEKMNSLNQVNWQDIERWIFTQGVKAEGNKLIIPANVTRFQIVMVSKEDRALELNETLKIKVGLKEATATLLDDDYVKANIKSLSGGLSVANSSGYLKVAQAKYSFATYVEITAPLPITLPSNIKIASIKHAGGNLIYALIIPPNTQNWTIRYNTPGNIGDVENFTFRVNNQNFSAANLTRASVLSLSLKKTAVGEGGAFKYVVNVKNNKYSFRGLAFNLTGQAKQSIRLGKISFTNGVFLKDGILVIPPRVTSFVITLPAGNNGATESNRALSLTLGGTQVKGWLVDYIAPSHQTMLDRHGKIESAMNEGFEEKFDAIWRTISREERNKAFSTVRQGLNLFNFAGQWSVISTLPADATYGDFLLGVQKAISAKRATLRTNLKGAAINMMAGIRTRESYFSFSGTSSDVIDGMETYFTRTASVMDDFRNDFEKFTNYQAQWQTTIVGTNQQLMSFEDKSFFDGFDLDKEGGRVSLPGFYDLVGKRLTALSDGIKSTVDDAISKYDSKVASENFDKTLITIFAVLGTLQSFGSLFSLWSSLSKITKELADAAKTMQGTRTWAQYGKNFFFPNANNFYTKDGPASIGSSISSMNSTGAATFLTYRADALSKSKGAGWDDASLGPYRINLEAQQNTIQQPLNNIAASLDTLLLKIFSEGRAGDSDQIIEERYYYAYEDKPVEGQFVTRDGYSFAWWKSSGWWGGGATFTLWGIPASATVNNQSQAARLQQMNLADAGSNNLLLDASGMPVSDDDAWSSTSDDVDDAQLLGDEGQDQFISEDGEDGVDTLLYGAQDEQLYGDDAYAGGGVDSGGDVDAGNAVLQGGGGNEYLVEDRTGNDTYIVDSTQDVITENANEGIDLVQSSVTYTLAANVENLTLADTDSINGTGNAGNNVLIGNIAANTLSGGAGHDTLDGGAGADILVGGTGNDTYRMARGYGADTVIENDTTAGNTDVALFGINIATEQLWFRKVSDNLEVSVIGTADKFTLNNWYLGSRYHVEQFKTSDGQTLLDSQVQNLVQAMASFAPPPAGQTTLSGPQQAALAPVIAANWV